MRTIGSAVTVVMVLSLSACVVPPPPRRVVYAEAPRPERHPGYQHAITDLQAARDAIDRRRPEDGRILRDEQVMHDELSAALGDLRRAAELDGKFGPLPPPDVDRLPEGRLRAAVVLMRRAQADIARPEDNPNVRYLQQRALDHLGAALDAAARIDRQLDR